MENLFTAVFQKTDKWWIAFVEELPGANAQGETIDEARENLLVLMLSVVTGDSPPSMRKSIDYATNYHDRRSH